MTRSKDLGLTPAGWGAHSTILRIAAASIFVIPALTLLFNQPASRFGFQMYSGYGETKAHWIDSNGQSHAVVLTDHVASPRIEIDWTTRLPRRLCADLTDAVHVEVSQTARGGTRVVSMGCQR